MRQAAEIAQERPELPAPVEAEARRPRAMSVIFTAGLVSWGIGVQSTELLASLGMAVCVIGVLVGARADRREALRTVGSWWPLLAFGAWALLAPLVAGRPATWTGVARLGDWFAIPFAGAAYAIASPRQRRILAVALGGVFLLSCSLAGLQHFGCWPSLDHFSSLRWTRLPFHRVYEPIPGSNHRFMGGGLLFHRLKFSHVGGLAVVTALAWGLRLSGRWRRIALAVAEVGFVSIVLFPAARAATAALILAVVVTLGLAVRRKRIALIASGVVVLLAGAIIAVSPGLRARFEGSISVSGSGERNLLLASGWAAVREHPIAGVGLGRFRPALYLPKDAPEDVLENTGKSHNQFLSMAAETGIPGALLFIGLLVALARRVDRSAPGGVAGLSALAFFVLLSQVHDPLYQAPFSMALALALGLALAPGRSSPPTG